MTVDNPGFPEYGYGGDMVGARRARRAFRLCVAALVLFALLLWFAERYLRYDLAECQYIAALTLEPESARAILRYVVKRDTASNDKPTPKYAAALAEREERDEILPAYERAYKLDPLDPVLAVRYGCRLFMAERYSEARERFREAGLQAADNALPGYLEAAALALSPNGDLAEAMLLVARANGGGMAVVFPAPLWARCLPPRGVWYSRLRRAAVEESCGPLYRFVDHVIACAGKAGAGSQAQQWKDWIESVRTMGQRVADGKSGEKDLSVPGTLQAAAGVRFELAAVEKLMAISETDSQTDREMLATRRDRLGKALEILNRFEAGRDSGVERDRARYLQPLQFVWQSALVLMAVYALARLLVRFRGGRNDAMTLPQLSVLPASVVFGGVAAVGLLLAAGNRHVHDRPGLESAVVSLWWTGMIVFLILGLVYPRLRLPSLRVMAARYAITYGEGEAFRALVRGRRDAKCLLLMRGYGLMLGAYLCAISCWTILFRIACDAYPWQFELLVSGMERQESAALMDALRMLAG